MPKTLKYIVLAVLTGYIFGYFPLENAFSHGPDNPHSPDGSHIIQDATDLQEEEEQEEGEAQAESEWVLVWYDEFDGEEVDTSKWRIEDAALNKNNELQYYSPEEVYIEEGNLVLRSQKKAMGGRRFTSGLVETKGRYSQQYGFFEVRAKLPKGQGIWPAHWLMNTVGTWPPEIDIMELIGHKPNKVHMTNHWGVYPKNKHKGETYVGPDFSADFHTFGLEWTPEVLRWYIDGEMRYSTEDNVPKVPFYLILNTAVGGDWPKAPDATTVFPQYHYIDYVRIYKRRIPGTAFLVTASENGRVIADPKKDRYPAGSVVQLKAIADIGYMFAYWEGDVEGSQNPVEITLEDAVIVKAVFEEDPDAPVLISKNKEVTASSTENEKLAPSHIVDGDLKTRWSSKFTDPQWVTIDLKESFDIAAVKIYWETAHGREYKIQVSDDGVQWETVESVDDNIGEVRNIFLEGVTARYVRLMGLRRATEWGYSLYEIEVYGK